MSSLSRLVEVVAPRRFGTGFRWLLSSSWISNLGDGIALAAGPLLVASLTHDPVLGAATADRVHGLVTNRRLGALSPAVRDQSSADLRRTDPRRSCRGFIM